MPVGIKATDQESTRHGTQLTDRPMVANQYFPLTVHRIVVVTFSPFLRSFSFAGAFVVIVFALHIHICACVCVRLAHKQVRIQ